MVFIHSIAPALHLERVFAPPPLSQNSVWTALKICRDFPKPQSPSFSKLVEVSLAIRVSRVGLKVKIVDEEGHRQQSGFHLNTFVKVRGTQTQNMPKSKYKLL